MIQKIEPTADARVIVVDPKNHVIKINDGTNLYKKLLLAIGNQARHLSILGDKLDGICIRKIKQDKAYM